ncbi:MAG: glutathione S-transferase family protein [Alphaproteobacteria bacterium]|nr:glutathione S-transferase family protein [Alphaproteobacteria bacterium]
MTARELYFISGSPPCWSVMLALEVKGLAYTPRRLDNAKREQKSPEYLAINPRGQVPVLIDGDITVCETLAVLSYLDAATPAPPLFGTSPIETAKIWQSICDCDGNLREPVGQISRPLFRGKADEFIDQITGAAETVRDELSLYETMLQDNGWLAGDSLSAADLIVFPVIMQLLRAAGRDDAAPLQLAIYPLADHFPNLAGWVNRIEALPRYANAYPPHWK